METRQARRLRQASIAVMPPSSDGDVREHTQRRQQQQPAQSDPRGSNNEQQDQQQVQLEETDGGGQQQHRQRQLRSHRPTFPCVVCGSVFQSEELLKQHIRRKTCRGNMQLENNCEFCGRSFSTYMGLRQHIRLAHRSEYNQLLVNEVPTTSRRPWTVDEQAALARMEAELGSTNPTAIIDHLAANSTRSRDAIKKRRQRRSYVNMVQSLREEAPGGEGRRSSSSEYESAEETEVVEEDPDEPLKQALRALRLSSDDERVMNRIFGSREEGCQALEGWTTELVAAQGARAPVGAHVGDRFVIRGSWGPRRRRAKEFRMAQKEYQSNPRGLADRIFEGRGWMPTTVGDLTEVERQFAAIFAQPSIDDDEPVRDRCPNVISTTEPITRDEVTGCLKEMKSNTPGPDGITLINLRRVPINKLLFLFNACLLLGYTPTTLKKSRTVFIPKAVSAGAGATAAWRPITISSMIVRLFHKILSRRLERVLLCRSQRGFCRLDGCFANVVAVNSILKYQRRLGHPLCLVSLDISKAFDTVSHTSVVRALGRVNVDGRMAAYVAQNLEGATTSFGGSAAEIVVRRGVKQGDPLSPLLFNVVLDELVTSLNSYSGIRVEGTQVRALAYADDLLLFASNAQDAERMVEDVRRFVEARGMSINPTKSHVIRLETVPSKKKVLVRADPIKCGVELIPSLDVEQSVRYLGAEFTPFGEDSCASSLLFTHLQRLKRAPLKPSQKLRLLRDFLMPRYIAFFQKPTVTRKVLKEADRKIRIFVRGVLHFNPHSHNSILYAPVREGGLGLFCLSERIPGILADRVRRLRAEDVIFDAVMRADQAWADRIAGMVGPHSERRANKEFHAAALEASFSGCGGLRQVSEHRQCNGWIYYPPQSWSGGDYVKAVLLRYNLLPCKGIPSNPVSERRCRAEHCRRQETVCHILQACNSTHVGRMQRHNCVQDKLVTRARANGWQVHVEKHIYATDGLRKPDLILVKGSQLVVSDIGVHWEGEEPLATHHQAKIRHYSTQAFMTKMLEHFPGCSVAVLPYILGARGGWCPANSSFCSMLGITSDDVRGTITSVLKGGWLTHSTFMRCVWDRMS